jgi:acyl-CoA synthetase (AMP-forming)/AMP-acid ligase II
VLTRSPATARWSADPVAAEIRAALLGPGAPFELRDEQVNGVTVQVFASRPRSMSDVLGQAVAAHPDRVFLAFPDEQLTYRDAADEVARLAHALAERGVRPGDRVAFASANTVEYVLTMWAVMHTGAIVVGLNGWWTPAEFEHALALTTPALVLADEKRADVLAQVTADVPVTLLTDIRDSARVIGAAETTAPTAVDEDAPAMILFTSGTTGRAKGATLSQRNLVHFGQVNLLRGAIAALSSGVAPDPTFQSSAISVSPLFHVSGSVVLFGAPWTGGKIVYPEPGRWDETVHLELSAKHRVTMWSGVPTQLHRLVEHPRLDDYDLSALRAASSGGAMMPPALIQRYRERLPQVAVGTGYGSSETSGLGTGINGPEYVAHPTSVGGPVPTSEVQVRRPDGSVADTGETGEVFLRSASVFSGYWNDPAATAGVLDGERWYGTGDFGRLEDGRLHLDGRARDRIIRGGENISPLEVEHRLVAHPQIEDAAVIGVDHEVLGQEVLAVVVRNDDALDASEVRDWAGLELAAFKVPTHVVFVAALPYTASGKVQKRVLEQQSQALLDGTGLSGT